MRSVAALSLQLEAGEVSSTSLTSECLDRILDKAGEGALTFTMIDSERSFAQAKMQESLLKQGKRPSPLSGIPISIKNLFDLQGKVTIAGSKVLAKNKPARRDAVAIARLRSAGAVIMGHTNMTEFAYSGLGLNPHYGTPANPYDQSRIPGGSSSGAAVSVATAMSAVGLGTDTGGSCRIPAAFCGLVGFKPTARRVPLDGVFPLSKSFDSVGSIGRHVACCEVVDRVLASESAPVLGMPNLTDLRFAVLDNYVLENLTPGVATAFNDALSRLERAGTSVKQIRLPDLDNLANLNNRGGIIAAEAYKVHCAMLTDQEPLYDPRVSTRIYKGNTQPSGEYEDLLKTRVAMQARAAAVMDAFDAIIMPTVACEAPRFVDLENDDAYGAANTLCLRNTTVANFLDRCAITLPIPVDGLPVGLSLMAGPMEDRRLFAVARAVEKGLEV